MARQIDLDQLMKYPLRRGSEHCDEKNADPRFLNGVESILEWAQTLPTLTPPNEWVSVEDEIPSDDDDGLEFFCMTNATGKCGGVLPLEWEVATVRGKTVRRWKWRSRISPWAVTHWMKRPAPPGENNNVPTKAPNEPLTLEQLREMDGEPVWVEDVKHWALIDIEKGGQWDGVPFAVWAENGVKFTYNVESRDLHCYRRPPEGEE